MNIDHRMINSSRDIFFLYNYKRLDTDFIKIVFGLIQIIKVIKL